MAVVKVSVNVNYCSVPDFSIVSSNLGSIFVLYILQVVHDIYYIYKTYTNQVIFVSRAYTLTYISHIRENT